jgi:hypothetical protein
MSLIHSYPIVEEWELILLEVVRENDINGRHNGLQYQQQEEEDDYNR